MDLSVIDRMQHNKWLSEAAKLAATLPIANAASMQTNGEDGKLDAPSSNGSASELAVCAVLCCMCVSQPSLTNK